MLFGNHAEGVGYGPLFGYTKLVAARWLLGSGLDNVFVGKLGELLHLQLLFQGPSVHPRGQCGIIRIPPCYREQRSVRFGWDLGHAEQAQGIVLQLLLYR